MQRVRTLICASALLLGTACAVSAADLPVSGEPLAGAAFGPPRATGLITNPFRGQHFAEPRRFDAYGYPVPGPVVVRAPNPLYAATGCPEMLQPVYDGAGNFAGYSPFPDCR